MQITIFAAVSSSGSSHPTSPVDRAACSRRRMTELGGPIHPSGSPGALGRESRFAFLLIPRGDLSDRSDEPAQHGVTSRGISLLAYFFFSVSLKIKSKFYAPTTTDDDVDDAPLMLMVVHIAPIPGTPSAATVAQVCWFRNNNKNTRSTRERDFSAERDKS